MIERALKKVVIGLSTKIIAQSVSNKIERRDTRNFFIKFSHVCGIKETYNI